MLDDKTLLVTGGTGSFGNAVVERFLSTSVREIRVFSRDEKKQDDMRNAYRSDKLKFYLGDVRQRDGLRAAMHGVDLVFHAAALKQVPSCEFFPMEAVQTNIEGTDNLLDAATEAGVKRVIALSTDKAVYPVNAMGMSKALMEKVMVARARSAEPRGTVVCGTRYGNVIASRGSVIPLFIQQIKAGQPLTVTDPEMTRFIMSLENAVDLVLFAFENGRAGDLFVQKAPACTVGDLAKALLGMFGARNEIRVIGTRHGEKRYETLLHREEMVRAEDLGDYFRIPADVRDLNYAKYFVEGEQRITQRGDYDSENTRRLGVDEIAALLATIPYVRSELGR
jgi:UDP-glucose 4-epimerase